MSRKIIFTDNTNSILVSYLRDIAKYKILDNEELNALIIKAQNGDYVAKEKVIKSNLRFVVTIAKQFQNRGIPLMDLISSGNEGLIKSISKYDIERGVPFISYAVWWIKQCIYNSIYWHSREIRLPMTQQLLINNILDTTTKFLQKNHRNPSSEELSELTDIPVEQIDYLAQFSNKLISVDDFVGGDEDNSQVCDIIPDNEESLEDTINKEYVHRQIEIYVSKLSTREQDIIRMIFGIGINSVPPKLIASMFGIGTERLRQIKEGALKKLRRVYGKQLQNLR